MLKDGKKLDSKLPGSKRKKGNMVSYKLSHKNNNNKMLFETNATVLNTRTRWKYFLCVFSEGEKYVISRYSHVSHEALY